MFVTSFTLFEKEKLQIHYPNNESYKGASTKQEKVR